MSFLKKPFRKLTGLKTLDHDQTKAEPIISPSSSSNTNTSASNNSPITNGKSSNGSATPNGSTTPPEDRRKSREAIREERARRSLDKERQKIEAKKRQTMRRIESENFMRDAPPELTKLYKPFSMNMSKRWNHENRRLFKDLDFASKSHPDAFRLHAVVADLTMQKRLAQLSLSELAFILFVE